MIRYLSICAGIEAFSVATHGLDYVPAAFSEIDRFASAVLAHRFGSNLPGEPLSGNAPPNIGDFTHLLDDAALRERLGRIDLLVGGTPCQAFSFAGKRLSLADARGNLTLAFAVLAHELARSHGCRNALWENVPGVLSTPDNAFGCFLGALVGADAPLDLPAGIGRWPDEGMVEGPGARAAWRLLDAQYFGLAQRRERVFVVVDLGGGADPAAVLFEPQGLRGNSPPRREAGQKPAPAISARTHGGGGLGTDFELDGGLIAFGGNNTAGPIDVATALNAHGGPMGRMDFESETFIAFSCKDHGADAGEDIAPTLRAMGHGESHANAGGQVAVAYGIAADAIGRSGEASDGSADGRAGLGITEELSPTLKAQKPNAVAFSIMPQNSGRDYKAREVEVAQPLMAGGPVGGNQGGDYVLQPVAFQQSESGMRLSETHATLDANNGSRRHNGVLDGWAVRRLTPTECARLQGFPDDHSRIPWRGKPAELCPDGPQYKTYGNSMAVKVMAWLARRLSAAMNERTAA